jgi:hypothetical protein
MKSKFCLPLSGKAAGAILGAAALMAAGGALAETPQPATGLMTFKNVRVQAATPAQLAADQRMAPGEAGARAFKDPETGELRAPEEGEVVSSRAKRAGGSPTVAYRNYRGGISVALDESFESNSVVTRTADGKLEMQCVKGEDALAHARHAQAGKARHDR